jgi:hypothetical protein
MQVLLESKIRIAYIRTRIRSSNRALPPIDTVEARNQSNDGIDIPWFTDTKDVIKAPDYTIH